MTKRRECRGDIIKMRRCRGASSVFMMEANTFPTRIRPKKLFRDKLLLFPGKNPGAGSRFLVNTNIIDFIRGRINLWIDLATEIAADRQIDS